MRAAGLVLATTCATAHAESTPCVLAPLPSAAGLTAPKPDGRGPEWITLQPGVMHTFDKPIVAGEITQLSGACALRASGELTCFTPPRLAKKPAKVILGVEDVAAYGTGVLASKVVSWGTVPLPRGPRGR